MERVGIGYDIHRLVVGRKLILGGIEIPFEKGLQGHSDADVLTHAVCDALLGAVGKSDIGEHFPDTDLQYKNISSLVLLKKVMELVGREGFVVVNLDTIIIAEKPNLRAVKASIRSSLAKHLRVRDDAINVKAKTTEGLGFGLSGDEAIAAQAIVLLAKER